MDASLYNCTPHDIHVYDAQGMACIRRYPRLATCPILRVLSKEQKQEGLFDDIVPLISPQKPNGFSQEHLSFLVKAVEEKATLFVSGYTAEEILKIYPNYPGNIFSPCSAPDSVVRDEKGQIKGVRCFEVWKLR